MWIYFRRFARSQQRTDDTHGDGSLMVVAEQVVLSTQCDWSDGILRQIVINMDTSILQIPHHILPAGIAFPVRLFWLYFIPSVSIHSFKASIIGLASSWRFPIRSFSVSCFWTQSCSMRYRSCISFKACSVICLFSASACSKYLHI